MISNFLISEPLCTLKNYWGPQRVFVYWAVSIFIILKIKAHIFKIQKCLSTHYISDQKDDMFICHGASGKLTVHL